MLGSDELCVDMPTKRCQLTLSWQSSEEEGLQEDRAHRSSMPGESEEVLPARVRKKL